MPLTAGSKLGPYEILSLLGAGGMGEVYRARDPRLARDVAIKVLPADRMADEDRRRRFLREARAASGLNHPNIVTVHEIDSVDGIDFIVMEYVAGLTLDALIPRNGMRLGDVLQMAIAIADALASAHSHGIVHRDLKPANVAVSRDGVVKVLDFGLAKLVADEMRYADETLTGAANSGPLSRPGVIAGTAAYMSPEQATGKKLDARSDVFSFGAVLYEMVTGQRAFAGKSTAEILASVMKDSPRAPSEVVPGVPKELERLVLRCLQKDPDRRFQHMVDVKVELNEIKEESASQPPTEAVAVRQKRRSWPAAGLVTVLLLAAVAWLRWHPGEPELPPPTLVPLTSLSGSGSPTFSPDGGQIAFEWAGENGDNTDIYIKVIGSSETRRLTSDPAADVLPSWSPDGRQIAFLRDRSGGPSGRPRATLHLVSPIGGSERRLGVPGPGVEFTALVVARRPLLGRVALRLCHGERPPSRAVNGVFRSLPLRRHAPTLAVLGDAKDLAPRRRLVRFGCAEPEVVEDLANGEGVGHQGDDAHALAAASADGGSTR